MSVWVQNIDWDVTNSKFASMYKYGDLNQGCIPEAEGRPGKKPLYQLIVLHENQKRYILLITVTLGFICCRFGVRRIGNDQRTKHEECLLYPLANT